jgi:hypothetical protein
LAAADVLADTGLNSGRATTPPPLEANQPPTSIELRHALATIEYILGDYVTDARLGAAA